MPAIRTASRLAAIIASQLAAQTQAVQRALKDIEEDIPEYGAGFVSDLVEAATKSVIKKMKRFRPSQSSSMENETLQLADDWAGPVAGPTMIERHYGIPRSTLYRWQKVNEVVAINTRSSRKPVFPLRQFVDGRPAQGIAEVVAAFGDQKRAWQWLLTPNARLNGGKPLEMLLQGEVDAVVDVASSPSDDSWTQPCS
ncbi:hypothetical protein ASD50_19510 [Mesorhizobium sp. Root552]|nr:hypothetical protein ASD50_19510 [Mesorhizobium sp. Root552]